MAQSRRQPPPVPHISILAWDQAKTILEKYLREIGFDSYDSYPAPHAETHMRTKGESDSVSGLGPPSSITPGLPGSTGDATAGFAPIGHVHGTTDLADLVNPLESDPLTGEALIADLRLRRLLSAILVALYDLEGTLYNLYGNNEMRQVTALPVVVVPGSTTARVALAENHTRSGVVFYNDSTATCFIKYGLVPSSTSYTYKVFPNGTLEIDNNVGYTGIITCVCDAANGNLYVTEMVRK